jgi:hypothetical protein
MKKVLVLITVAAFAAGSALAQTPSSTQPNDRQGTTTQPATPAQPATPQTQPATPATPASPSRDINTPSRDQTTPSRDRDIQNRQSSNVQRQQKDGMVYREGKLWNMKAGKSTAVDKEMTLSNGTKVRSDGTVIMKDGTQTTLSEGDYISMDGKLERAKPTRVTEKNDMDDNKDYKDKE